MKSKNVVIGETYYATRAMLHPHRTVKTWITIHGKHRLGGWQAYDERTGDVLHLKASHSLIMPQSEALTRGIRIASTKSDTEATYAH